MTEHNLFDPMVFSDILFGKMKLVNPGIVDLELYEFRYGLNNLVPQEGWSSVHLDAQESIEALVNNRLFYDQIQIKPKVSDVIVLDENILRLTRMLLVGLVTGKYPVEWVNEFFYFDIRGFYFLHRTVYFTDSVRTHFGGEPFGQFELLQKRFDHHQDIGYKEFKTANQNVDGLFFKCIKRLIAARGIPILLAIAGPTAAGKTEIVERLKDVFAQDGKQTTSIEMDNFLTDREYREEKGIFTQGKAALHFELFTQSLQDISRGRRISIPRYDFVYATSSHDLAGKLKPDGVPIEIEPADIVFIEGNFPFLIEEVVNLIGIKVVYLTDDPIRLKRKWKRDIDYRKKYEPTYFRNRFFKDQFIMAEIAYRPQLEVCDMAVDTTNAALWITPEIRALLDKD